MRSPRDFFKPLAVGAPEPVREIPFRPSRVIHFFPPQNEKLVAKLPELVPTVDILLGNLEDAIPMADKEAARAMAVRTFPAIAPRFYRVKDHNRAEALLIARYGQDALA